MTLRNLNTGLGILGAALGACRPMVLGAAIAMAGFASAMVPDPAQAQNAPVKVGFAGSVTWLGQVPIMVANDKGFFKDEGIDLTLKDPATGAECVMTAHYDMPMAAAFATAADMGMIDPPTMIDPCPAHNLVAGGNSYSLTARYDNSQPYAAVMGIALAYVWRGHQ